MEDQNEQLWLAVLGELELSLSKASFTTWLKNTFIIKNDEGCIEVGVPNTFSQAWLKQKYHQQIYKIIQTKSKERIKEINYKVQSLKSYNKQIDELKKTVSTQEQIPEATQNEVLAKQTKKQGLNVKYLFDSFIVGKANELAHAAALAVAEKPGLTYNPLFIYGGVGLGKTHLLQSVGHAVSQKNPEKKIVYVTCEQFTNDFISSISSGQAVRFNNTYRTADVLLIDDIQFLTGKEGTQEAFFHTFNDLHQRDKQIVITSDRPPKAISTLEDRLLSRFEWGMIADISQPDLETRIAILETKCQEKEFLLERDIIQYITLNIQNNIRELEGALNKIIAYHQLNKLEPTLENIKKILFSISESSKKGGAVSAKQLIDLVSGFYELSLDDILGKSREKRLAFPRQIIMYLLREELSCSYPMIGSELGGRDHTTAMHAYDKISRLIAEDEKLRQEINLIKQKVYSS
ncbi:chromosomal replication initiator protein DnaA [Candidatus Falkowbacteria bacterium]|jgi:chromosomal replication initiator protein|nr:chromosomal replication initiator protein DnaA [Candidatus Falkowbacteria bacterium]MBT6574041.1 chromosomal replication initiator protein DnaA [Candidatus Falkowbacteria bacterium]MBT7348610.1 chromosomal replication initiator protein DnaA [Candidatus Falkowbacteria bacterium]MBT7500401.1 chromosomal replication initiator protein DnaA [Candidatus Falkowbacteria bacterium]